MEDQVTTDLRFSIVPHWIMKRDISDRAVRLYAVLARFADAETAQAFPGRTRLSKELKCSLRSVDRAVAELEDIGAIRKQQRVKDGVYQSSLYTVVRGEPVSPVTRPRDMDDTTPCQDWHDPVSPVAHITRTTEVEPLKQEPLNKRQPKNADEYEPSQTLLEELATKFPHVSLEDQLERFRDHHMAKGSKFSLWDRAFRKWVTQSVDWKQTSSAAKPERLTNNQKAALLAMKYREEARKAQEIEPPVNPEQVKQIEAETTSWLKGIDDV